MVSGSGRGHGQLCGPSVFPGEGRSLQTGFQILNVSSLELSETWLIAGWELRDPNYNPDHASKCHCEWGSKGSNL